MRANLFPVCAKAKATLSWRGSSYNLAALAARFLRRGGCAPQNKRLLTNSLGKSVPPLSGCVPRLNTCKVQRKNVLPTKPTRHNALSFLRSLRPRFKNNAPLGWKSLPRESVCTRATAPLIKMRWRKRFNRLGNALSCRPKKRIFWTLLKTIFPRFQKIVVLFLKNRDGLLATALPQTLCESNQRARFSKLLWLRT